MTAFFTPPTVPNGGHDFCFHSVIRPIDTTKNSEDKNMYERMLNRNEKPTFTQMMTYCGEMATVFKQLNEWMAAEFSTEETVTFPYGNSYGWCFSHRKKGKLMCNIFPEDNAFTVMLRMDNSQFAAAYDDLCEYARTLIDNKYPCNDGGWIHYRVSQKIGWKT